MNVFNIFRKKETNTEVLQNAHVTLYPEQILVQAYDRAKEGFWIGTTNLVYIADDASNEHLGSIVRSHMSLTRTGQKRPSDWKAAHKLFLKAAGFKTEKEEYRDAKNVGICRKGSQLTISISINGEYNGRTRGFWGNGVLEFDNNISDAELGQHIREAFELCK